MLLEKNPPVVGRLDEQKINLSKITSCATQTKAPILLCQQRIKLSGVTFFVTEVSLLEV